jgi:hypothetical protein
MSSAEAGVAKTRLHATSSSRKAGRIERGKIMVIEESLRDD